MKRYLYPIDVVYLDHSSLTVSVSSDLQIYWISDGYIDIREYHTDSGNYVSRRVGKNEIYIANRFSLYTISFIAYEAVLFTVHPDRFKEAVFSLFPSRFVLDQARAEPVEALKLHLAQYTQCRFLDTNGARLRAESLSIQIMIDLIEHFSGAGNPAVPENPDKYFRMLSVCKSIEASYKEDLSLEQIAGKYHMTPQYLSRLFKEVLHMTVFEYINQVRLSHALNMLHSRRWSMEQIAEQCGFANVRAFTHVFRKSQNMLPGEYRRQLAAGDISDSFDALSSASYQLLESYASMEELKVPMLHEPIPKLMLPEMNLCVRGVLWKKNYLRTICVSDASYLLYEQYQSQVREAHRDLRFTYVRLQNLFWDAMHVYFETADGKGHMNFNLIDTVMDFLHSIGLFPHIIIDVLPSLLTDKGKPASVKDETKWSVFLNKFITHCELRYEKSYVDLWRISVGIYMDNPSWEYYMDLDSLFHFYQSTRGIIRGANGNIRIGSPWFLPNQTSADSDLFRFLELCKMQSVLPDFITFNYFPVIFPETFGFVNTKQIFSSDKDEIRNYLSRLESMIKEREAAQLRLVLVDWNYSVGTNFLNDTLFRAVYTLKNILDNYDSGVEFCTDVLSDFMGGLPTDLQFFPGGIGLFTQQNMKKPIYYMFQLLNRLGAYVVAAGEYYFITRTENAFQILMYHYVHYINERSRENTFDIPYQDRYLPFANATPIELTIPVYCDFAGEFHIIETVINRRHGSAYDIWEQSGFISLEQQESVNFINHVSVPFTSSDTGKFVNNVCCLTRTLEPLEMRLIEMTWR